MITSKVKAIKSVSEPWGTNGILWHLLEMDNGDKINIGKMKKQEIGYELTYEITGEGHESNKGKSVNPNNYPSSPRPAFKKDDNVQKMIVKQSSLKSAVDFCDKGCSVEDVLKVAQKFTNWVLEDNTKKLDNFDQRLNNKVNEITNNSTSAFVTSDNEDLPF